MDPHGHIYALSDEEREALLKPVSDAEVSDAERSARFRPDARGPSRASTATSAAALIATRPSAARAPTRTSPAER